MRSKGHGNAQKNKDSHAPMVQQRAQVQESQSMSSIPCPIQLLQHGAGVIVVVVAVVVVGVLDFVVGVSAFVVGVLDFRY
jgi:hypothetical protein